MGRARNSDCFGGLMSCLNLKFESTELGRLIYQSDCVKALRAVRLYLVFSTSVLGIRSSYFDPMRCFPSKTMHSARDLLLDPGSPLGT